MTQPASPRSRLHEVEALLRRLALGGGRLVESLDPSAAVRALALTENGSLLELGAPSAARERRYRYRPASLDGESATGFVSLAEPLEVGRRIRLGHLHLSRVRLLATWPLPREAQPELEPPPAAFAPEAAAASARYAAWARRLAQLPGSAVEETEVLAEALHLQHLHGADAAAASPRDVVGFVTETGTSYRLIAAASDGRRCDLLRVPLFAAPGLYEGVELSPQELVPGAPVVVFDREGAVRCCTAPVAYLVRAGDVDLRLP